jgi:subtilase family serine protease
MAWRQVSVQFSSAWSAKMTLSQPGRRSFFVLVLFFLIPFRFSAAQSTAIAPRIVQPLNEKQLITLRGNVHPLARPEFDQGSVADSQPMTRMLLLLQRGPEQEATLRQLLDDQQSKSSPNFHRWLTPEEFGAQFGPADSDLLAVTQWLASQGFTDINVGPGHGVIEFSGNAAQVRNAFHTEIHQFRVGVEDHLANISDPQIPAALAPAVAGIVSLHNFPRKSHSRYLGAAHRERNGSKLQPLFTFPYGNGNFYALGPGDFSKIYNAQPLISAGIDGTGQTIAVVGETQINPQDVSDFRSVFGLPDNFSSSNIVLNGMDPGITSQGEESESDLDVQWSGGVAPGATVKFVLSASTSASAGIDLSSLYIVENNLADVMSVSYGACEADLGSVENAFYNQLWEQAAAQGITVAVSSGDGGSAGCDDFNDQAVATRGIAVSGLAGTPFNVSVGGTDFNQINVWANYWNTVNDTVTGSSANGYIPETPWNENCAQLGPTGCGASAPQGSVNIVAGSGGPSGIYGKPKWQMGVLGVPNDNHRDQPDISLFASSGFTGSAYIVCQSDRTGVPCNLNSYGYTFHLSGGTSASAPAFAGIMALVNQYQAAHGGSPRQGNPNYVLYALAKKSGASCASTSPQGANCIFNDVVKGNDFLKTRYGNSVGTNSVACQGGTPNCNSNSAAVNGVLVDPSHTSTEAWTAAAGYDMATGLGSLNVNNLATNWTSASTIGTTTTLALSPTTGITHGQNENVTITANVKPTSGSGVPSGEVSLLAKLSDGSTRGLDHFTLANGAITSAKTQNLPGGTYQVYAHYAGDGTNAPSDSPSTQVTVGKESSQTFIVVPSFDSSGNQLSGNANSVTYGSRYIIRMYVTNGSAVASTTGPPSLTCENVNQFTCPTGSVTLAGNSAPIDGGTFALNNQGYTRDIAPTLTGGTYSLAASYSGDNSYSPSTSATDTFTVTPAPTQLTLNANSGPLIGSPLSLYILGIPNVTTGANATGSVSIFDGNALVAGPLPVACIYCAQGEPATFSASTQVTFSTGGDHTITAKYSGDPDYAAAASSPIVVHPLYPTTMTVTASSTSVNFGQSVTITATVATSGKSPAMTGSFNFYGSYTPIPGGPITGTLSTDASGNQILTATVTTTPQSSEFLQVNFTGDSNFEGAYNTSSLINVDIPDFSLNLPSSSFNIMAGQTGTLQISVTPATNNASPVTLSCNGNMPAGYSCSIQPLIVNLANGISVPATLTLAPGSAAPAVMIHAASPKRNFLFLFPHWRNPLWPLAVLSGFAAFLCACRASNTKNRRASLGFGLACVISLIIGCGGGGTTTPPPPPPPGPFATSTALTTGSAKVAQGTQFTLTATVTGQGNPSGTVNFYANGGWIGTSNLTAGTTTLSATLPFAGLYSVNAQYLGDARNETSTSANVAEAVTGTTVFQVNGQTGSQFHSANVVVTLQ